MVYVDDMNAQYGRMKMSHLLADRRIPCNGCKNWSSQKMVAKP